MYKFKDENKFKKFNDETCYIPELSDHKYSGAEILRMCNGNKTLARAVFGVARWQSIGTIIDESLADGTINDLLRPQDNENTLIH